MICAGQRRRVGMPNSDHVPAEVVEQFVLSLVVGDTGGVVVPADAAVAVDLDREALSFGDQVRGDAV
jgi:hypothetical protein